jgi:hypothetical protein
MLRHFLSILLLATAIFAQVDQSASMSTGGVETGKMLGLGGRLTLSQRPMDDPRLWIDAHAILQPLPRLFLEGSWGRASETRRGNGPDTSFSETRWDLTAGVVLLQGAATGYVPLVWRKVTQKNSTTADAKWTEVGFGGGAIVPLHQWLALQTETLWMRPLDPHRDLALASGRESDGSHLELSFSLLAYLK